MDINILIEAAAKHNASDIHLIENAIPYFRIDGELVPVKYPQITGQEIHEILKIIMPEKLFEKLEKRRGADFSYQYKDMIRCRMIAFYERKKIKLVFRLIPYKIPSLEELEMPDTIKKIADFERGLVLVTGITGCGKSTTLASIIDYMNAHQKICITSIEDPIEFVHPNKMGIVSQREIGEDIETFSIGLIQALRQDPDVILVGEMRDPDTMKTAIRASETGHLVLSTLHTTSAVQTIERIIGTFPENEHKLLREQLASNLKAVITQQLVKKKDGKGRIAAIEIMIVNATIAKLIFDNRINDIAGIIRGGEDGMRVFDQGLAYLVREDKITEEEGLKYASDIYAYKRYIKGMQSSSDRGGIIGGFSG